MTFKLFRIPLVIIGFLLLASWSMAQADLFYYLPAGISYDEQIPTPKSVIGHEIGEWHTTHDKLVHYFYELAEVSPRVKVEKYGQTYEYRSLLNVIITSEKNHSKLEQLRQQHLKLTDPERSKAMDTRNMPVVIRLGYSIHGNEASGANASLLVAYHLAASQGKMIESILDNCIILIDPSLNPDGLQRFSTWVNEHKSKSLNPDPNSREFSEAWPNGRTNHYWFDLNRDWLLAQHPESIGRLKLFYEWMPNIQTDHHEMGSDATFFFQPGVPSRKNSLISNENVTLTEEIGKYHAKALDAHKRLYFTKETFDDFFFGKGSTYPDINGGIGILFEQASSRGHLRETENGELSFPFAIKNHFIASLSTIEAANDLKEELLNYQRDFYINATTKNKEDKNRALIFGSPDDPARTILLGRVLLKHKIKIYIPKEDIRLNDHMFTKGASLIVPLDQPQNNLVKAIFERKTTFKDSLFYDISAWNFDLAYNTPLAWIENKNSVNIIGEEITELELPKGGIEAEKAYAYAINWNQYYAPAMIDKLLKKELILKVATEPFTDNSGRSFDRGTILIPIGLQPMSEESVFDLLENYASLYHIKVDAIESGLASSGVDLGSSGFKNIHLPTIAMIVDDGVSSYEAGEVWHLLDQRYDIQVTLLSSDLVERIKLGKYNVLVFPGGSYSGLNTVAQEKVKEWIQDGGTLVAWKSALRFISKLKVADLNFKKISNDTIREISYSELTRVRGAQVIGGAIFNMEIDTTHPLAYGYHQKTLPVFKSGTLILENAKNSISNPFRYTKKPLLSGYVSANNLKMISDSPAVSISSFGEGKVIAFTDNHNFRAFWYGTNRLFINSIFFGNLITTR